ncbi:helix-turn-helix domain-containing protein [Microlunatus flavus]|uniref:DNA binding domain-containing protein, excisionase family n=1 Tax=Microlunatus flavus TaxID=1036181 RepID=A0A1H9L8V2_9ACTN|nr:helix-turn-helix domain-containing protein [Microlunatus flavus]SER07912.1 DNA binding domain-containing protein, excisionase family [Microlunatus flavus]
MGEQAEGTSPADCGANPQPSESVARARYLSAEEAATYLNVSVRFIRRAASERRLRHVRVGKFVRFHPDDLDAFATVREPAPGPDEAVVSEVWRRGRAVAP